ncbi:MAG: hypothetical protein NC395_06755 [Prevotella sp.]|nr:hypothetical protein [Prevotella sp.]
MKEKIAVVIERISILSILINTLYLFWWDSARWEPGLAEMMGIGFNLIILAVSEIFLIVSIVCLKRIHKGKNDVA